MKSTASFCRKVFNMYCCLAIVCYTIWISMPLFWKERSLSFRMLVPFDPFKNDAIYWLCHLFQLAVVTKGLWCNVSIDTMIPGLIWQAAGQVRILKENLQGVIEEANKFIAEIEKNNNLGMEREKLRQTIIYAKISKCVVHHMAIKEYVKELEAVYSWPLFSQLLISVLVICVTLLELTIVSTKDVIFFEILSFLPAILTEIFLICFCGEILCYESQSLTKDMIGEDWFEMDIKSRKAVFLIMEGSKKPLIIKAGGLIDLSLKTFQTIMSRSYSMLAVLNSFQST
nr:odorant receptor 18 [Pachyrhinus yasumatsui]